jgi:hypothetical protein
MLNDLHSLLGSFINNSLVKHLVSHIVLVSLSYFKSKAEDLTYLSAYKK